MIPRFKVIKRNNIPRLIIDNEYSQTEVTLFPSMVSDLIKKLEPYNHGVTS